MSVNKYQPHVLVLPEDGANRELANGFVLGVTNGRKIQILPEVGGWLIVIETFLSEHVAGLRTYQNRHLVLLLDFDSRSKRFDEIKQRIPEDVNDRVFLLGTKDEPEALKSAGLGSYENIGSRLAAECREGSRDLWLHALLEQNIEEIIRLEKAVRGFLF